MRAPSNYRPGALLARLRANLGDCECRITDSNAAEFSRSDLGLRFEVREQVESHFLMHIVVAQFVFAVPGTEAGSARIRIRHRGAVRRTGLEFVPMSGDCTAISSMQTDEALVAALMPLDFTHCELNRDPSGWSMQLRHFGASEVVGRVPALRRYVPLAAAQRDALLASFDATRGVLLRECGRLAD